MKVTLESTSRVVTVVIDGAEVPARVWQGRTAGGVECMALVTRISCARSADSAEFDADLQEHAAPRVDVLECFPLRFIL